MTDNDDQVLRIRSTPRWHRVKNAADVLGILWGAVLVTGGLAIYRAWRSTGTTGALSQLWWIGPVTVAVLAIHVWWAREGVVLDRSRRRLWIWRGHSRLGQTYSLAFFDKVEVVQKALAAQPDFLDRVGLRRWMLVAWEPDVDGLDPPLIRARSTAQRRARGRGAGLALCSLS